MPRLDRWLLPALLAAGCAHSSRGMYGQEARYSSDHHGWIAGGKDYWAFSNPMTGCILRCRADVERWAAVNAAASHVRNQDQGAPNTGLISTLPLSVPAAVLLLPGVLVSKAVQGPKALDRRARGDAARLGKRLDEAAHWYALAVAQGDASALEPLAQVFLEAGREREAVEARRALVCLGPALGAAEWDRVEEWLREKGTEVPRCADDSKAPLAIPWED
jgi:hypothetical protein